MKIKYIILLITYFIGYNGYSQNTTGNPVTPGTSSKQQSPAEDTQTNTGDKVKVTAKAQQSDEIEKLKKEITNLKQAHDKATDELKQAHDKVTDELKKAHGDAIAKLKTDNETVLTSKVGEITTKKDGTIAELNQKIAELKGKIPSTETIKKAEQDLAEAKSAKNAAEHHKNAVLHEKNILQRSYDKLNTTKEELEATLKELKRDVAAGVLTKQQLENKLNIAQQKVDTANAKIKVQSDSLKIATNATTTADSTAKKIKQTLAETQTANHNLQQILIGVLAGCFLLLAIGGFIYTRNLRKKNQEIETKNKELEAAYKQLKDSLDEKQNLEVQIEKLEIQIEELESSKTNLEKIIQAAIRKGEAAGMVFPRLDSEKKYFFAETMTAAGPRKIEDFGLGEDVTGMIVREDFACFWVFDGVSDNHILRNKSGEYFSSRLLAQWLALEMQAHLGQMNQQTFKLQGALTIAIQEVMTRFQDNINKLSADEKKVLIAGIQSNDIPTIATTALVGLLSKQGHLRVFRIGVDKFIVLPQGKLVDPKKLEQKTDRIAFSIDYNEKTKLLVVSQAEINSEAHYFESEQGVHTVIGATDGISDSIMGWLKNQPRLDFSHKDTREKIALQKGKTNDDKSLCIIQIKSI